MLDKVILDEAANAGRSCQWILKNFFFFRFLIKIHFYEKLEPVEKLSTFFIFSPRRELFLVWFQFWCRYRFLGSNSFWRENYEPVSERNIFSNVEPGRGFWLLQLWFCIWISISISIHFCEEKLRTRRATENNVGNKVGDDD